MSELNELIRLAKKANKAYRTGSQIMSDENYDSMLERIAVIKPDSKFLKRVGYHPPASAGVKVKHRYPMGSISNAKNVDALRSWLDKVGDYASFFVATPKIDGMALSLYYSKGHLSRAITRGDGKYGIDVTRNARVIKGVLNAVSYHGEFEVRGEVFLRIKMAERLNREGKLKGKTVNPRNIASGAVQSKNPSDTKEKRLSFLAYTCFTEEELDNGSNRSELEQFELLNGIGFDTVPVVADGEYDEVLSAVADYEGRRDADLPMDGVVVTINDPADKIAAEDELGRDSYWPKYRIAFKFKSFRKTTVLKSVKLSLGRTGVCTPVAILEPVELGNTIVTKASLHNPEWMAELGLLSKDKLGCNVGGLVEVEKGGDVIPQVTKLVSRGGKKIRFPDTCPSCKKALTFVRTDGVLKRIECRNDFCPKRNRRLITHFVKTLGVDELGTKTIGLLFKRKLVREPSDLFNLKVKDLKRLPGFAEKSSKTVVANLEAAKRIELSTFLCALGIDALGKVTAAKVANRYKNLERVLEVDSEELCGIDGVGKVTSIEICDGLEWFRSSGMLDRFKSCGVEVVDQIIPSLDEIEFEIRDKKKGGDVPECFGEYDAAEHPCSTCEVIRVCRSLSKKRAVKDINRPLVGETFCVTGTLSKPRKVIESEIVNSGGRIVSSVTGITDFLILGKADRMSSKVKQAERHGVKIICEAELMVKLEET